MYMNKDKKNLATYKEFGKMLREVANIYSRLGETPLSEHRYEYDSIISSIRRLTHYYDFDYYYCPLKDAFLDDPIDVDRSKKWSKYLAECEEKGIEPDYNYPITNKDKKNLATYKEFGKMLREVANIYSRLGETPLSEHRYEYDSIISSIRRLTHYYDFDYYYCPLKDAFLDDPIDVDRSKKWSKYLAECEEKGIEPDYTVLDHM